MSPISSIPHNRFTAHTIPYLTPYPSGEGVYPFEEVEREELVSLSRSLSFLQEILLPLEPDWLSRSS